MKRLRKIFINYYQTYFCRKVALTWYQRYGNTEAQFVGNFDVPARNLENTLYCASVGITSFMKFCCYAPPELCEDMFHY